MKVVEKNIKELIPYENNPRDNDRAVEYVANSIKNFGFKVPVIIDVNNVIIAGHTRLKAAEILNMEKIPCIVANDLTDEQIKAFRLADNKTGEFSTWNNTLLEKELDELMKIDIDMGDFGFDMDLAEALNLDEENKMEENGQVLICPKCGFEFTV